MEQPINYQVMAKKNEKEERQEGEVLVAELDVDFGRTDLNLLRDKINELIRRG